MAAPRRNNNAKVTNVQLSVAPVSLDAQSQKPKPQPTNQDVSKRRLTATDNIRYIHTAAELPPYPSTDAVYRAEAYQDNIIKPEADYGDKDTQPYNAPETVTRARSITPKQRNSRLVQEGIRRAKDILQQQGYYQSGDVENLLSTKKVELPPFPLFMFIIAVLKDLIDIADITLVGVIITTIASVIFSVILFFWLFGKVSGKWWKKRVFKWLWKRYVAAIIIEFIPFLKIAPTMAIFVIMAHRRETKVVRAINFALEELKKVGAFRHIL
jgi:hypothetical protein